MRKKKKKKEVPEKNSWKELLQEGEYEKKKVKNTRRLQQKKITVKKIYKEFFFEKNYYK